MQSSTSFAEAQIEYEKAYKKGKKEGAIVPNLDDLLKEKNIQAPKEISLGLIQVPMHLIVGTKTAGRSSAFTTSFYPTLKAPSEFSTKWCNLYRAHLDEGIRDPIKVYEFMNKFYVQEGNKRVSVLKYFDAVSIPAYVTRIIPPWSNDKETRIYYEFMDFYHLSKINDIWFTQEGSFAKLQQLIGKRPDEEWSVDDRLTFNSIYSRFESAYYILGGKSIPIAVGDAFLFFIGLYDYQTIDNMTSEELKEKMMQAWKEFKLLITTTSLELQMNPTEASESKIHILSRLIPNNSAKLHVAFLYVLDKNHSAWTYSHELGRMYLEQAFNDQLSTTCYENVTEENAEQIIEQAIYEGNNLIFTTSPTLHKASLKAALAHPNVKILNCSLNQAQKNMRTYYARMYEGKFLMGAIAGCMSQSGNIGYIADYPIYGMIANINAFALGAKLVNPRAKIYLEWSTLKDHDIYETFKNNSVGVISGQDMLIPGKSSRKFGLYRMSNDEITNLAMPVWHWGKFYEKLIRNIMSGSWQNDESADETKGINYWWGMSSEIIDVICSQHLPIGTARLIELLRTNICEHNLNPFTGILYSQDGVIQDSVGKEMNPTEIVEMNWLAENVIGIIPKLGDLIDKARAVVEKQGVDTTKDKQ